LRYFGYQIFVIHKHILASQAAELLLPPSYKSKNGSGVDGSCTCPGGLIKKNNGSS